MAKFKSGHYHAKSGQCFVTVESKVEFICNSSRLAPESPSSIPVSITGIASPRSYNSILLARVRYVKSK